MIAVFGLLVFAIPIQQGYGLISGVSEFFDEQPNLYRIGNGVREFVQDPKDAQCTNPRFEIKDADLVSNPTKKLAETEGNFFMFLNEHGTDSYRYLKAMMPEGDGQPRYYGYVYDENNNKVTGFGIGLDSGSLVFGIETFGKDAVIDEDKRLYDFMEGKSKFGGLTKTAKQGDYRTNIVLYHYEQPRTEKKACTIVIDWEFSVNEKGESSIGDVHARTGTLVDVTAQFSPRQQSDLGMESFSIQCKEGYQKLSQKEHQSHGGRTACVTPETRDKLIERGWASDIIRTVQPIDISSDIEHATSSYMGKIIPTLDDFKDTLSEPYDLDFIFSKFGDPHDDIGSGIHIYVYELNDSTEIWIGYIDDIWYVKHMGSDGKMLEDLFVKNKENPENCPLSFNSRCFTGNVTEIVDGNTIQINGGSVRLAFLPAPNLDEEGGMEAKKFIEVLCPVGSEVLFDQDDLQPLDRYYGGVGVMGTPLGVVYCNGLNLNEELAESKYGQISTWFCENSEFGNNDWAKKNGCLE